MSETLAPKTRALFANAANKKLCAELEAAGNVILLPEISAARTAAFDDETNPLDFDWLIFSDTFAADFFLEKLGGEDFDFYELDAVRVCALGEAVSDRLRFVQVHADVIPPKLDAATVFGAISDYVSSEAAFEGLRFLLVREISQTNHLAETLRASGAVVSEYAPYEFQIAAAENLTRLKTLLKGGAADEFVFTSPFDATALQFLFGENLPDLLAETQISATDEITFQTLIEHGLRPLYFKK
jgi:uroporphyrinogen-III synthase